MTAAAGSVAAAPPASAAGHGSVVDIAACAAEDADNHTGNSGGPARIFAMV